MADLLTEKTLEFIERRQSRRGFLATCGKAALMLGAAMAGLHFEPRRAYAAPCCQGTPCGTGTFPPCPPTPGCPPTCSGGVPYICCDQGQVGSTNTLHQCFVCNCGYVGDCECEFDTGQPCP